MTHGRNPLVLPSRNVKQPGSTDGFSLQGNQRRSTTKSSASAMCPFQQSTRTRTQVPPPRFRATTVRHHFRWLRAARRFRLHVCICQTPFSDSLTTLPVSGSTRSFRAPRRKPPGFLRESNGGLCLLRSELTGSFRLAAWQCVRQSRILSPVAFATNNRI